MSATTNFEFEMPGVSAVSAKLAEFPGKLANAMEGALYRWSSSMMTTAKERTPVDTGNLRASGHMQLPETKTGETTILGGFGGPAGSGNLEGSNPEDVGYGFWVHENLEAHHEVGQAKFLESAISQHLPELATEIQTALEKAAKDSGL